MLFLSHYLWKSKSDFVSEFILDFEQKTIWLWQHNIFLSRLGSFLITVPIESLTLWWNLLALLPKLPLMGKRMTRLHKVGRLVIWHSSPKQTAGTDTSLWSGKWKTDNRWTHNSVSYEEMVSTTQTNKVSPHSHPITTNEREE